MEEKTTLGKFIMRKRREKHMTQKELADRLYVTESAVSKWERGISYPDISLVTSLCEELGITEHELVTASEDFRQRRIEKQARSYRRFTKIYLWTTSLMYAVSLLTCFICNLAVDHTLSWFFIVLTAEMAGFSLTTLPLLLPKYRYIGTLGAFFASLLLLLMTCSLYTGGNWFFVAAMGVLFGFSIVFLPLVVRALPLPAPLNRHKALLCFAVDTVLLFALIAVALGYSGEAALFFTRACPAALYSLILPWAMLVIIRYGRVNALYRTAACLAVSGGYILPFNGVMNVLFNGKPFVLPTLRLHNWAEENLNDNVVWLTVLFLFGLAALFVVGGIVLTVRGQRRRDIG